LAGDAGEQRAVEAVVDVLSEPKHLDTAHPAIGAELHRDLSLGAARVELDELAQTRALLGGVQLVAERGDAREGARGRSEGCVAHRLEGRRELTEQIHPLLREVPTVHDAVAAELFADLEDAAVEGLYGGAC